jgi:phosphoserine phosphatase RsbU/P
MSRALNSSLELPVVLNKILDELAVLLPYDSASVVLLDYEADPDEPKVRTAAARSIQAGPDEVGEVMPLKKVRGTREVVRSGKPVVINDTKNDPRWNQTPGSMMVEAWMGVPLRLRDQAVGVLNLNSNIKGRFGAEDQELVEAFADQACVAIENARAHELQIKQYEQELETAHAIQTSLLPSEVPPVPNLEIHAESLPARHVSGDYYQYLPLPDGKLGIAVGDVSGKGIPAALLMAVITTALRDEVLRHKSPASLLTQLNLNLLDRMQQNNMNSALLVALYDPTTRRTELSNGGMVQPYVRTPSGWEFVPVGGYPLGASARSNYSSKTVTLAPGSTLLFISDGVIEAQNHSDEFFGFERLEELLNGLSPTLTAKELVDCILQAVHQHLDGLEAQDDVTVVAMKSQDV